MVADNRNPSAEDVIKAEKAAARASIEARANALAVAILMTHDVAALQSLKGQAADIENAAPAVNAKIPNISAAVDKQISIVRTEEAVKDLMHDMAGSGPFPPSTRQEQLMMNLMTQDERNYFTNIDPNKILPAYRVDDEGNVVPDTRSTKEKGIAGHEAREAFRNIKYHSLSHEAQKELCKAEIKEGLRDPKDVPQPNNPAHAVEELTGLKESLDTMESHEISDAVEKEGGGKESAQKAAPRARKTHERYKHMDTVIDRAVHAHHECHRARERGNHHEIKAKEAEAAKANTEVQQTLESHILKPMVLDLDEPVIEKSKDGPLRFNPTEMQAQAHYTPSAVGGPLPTLDKFR